MPRSGDIIVHGPTILANNDDGQRNIFISTSAPLSSNGQNGDVWIVYA